MICPRRDNAFISLIRPRRRHLKGRWRKLLIFLTIAGSLTALALVLASLTFASSNKRQKAAEERVLPTIPIRNSDLQVEPKLSIIVGRPKSVNAMKLAQSKDNKLFLIGQRHQDTEVPHLDDLLSEGTVATITNVHQRDDGIYVVDLEGSYRAEILELYNRVDFLEAKVRKK